MVTTAVGVRDLKRRATELVRDAARGRRVVITRYGRPSALLGPVTPGLGGRGGPLSSKSATWRAEREAFERLVAKLGKRLRGRYVAVHRGRIAGVGASPDELFERLWKKLHGGTFFIGRVGDPPALVDMPGFSIE